MNDEKINKFFNLLHVKADLTQTEDVLFLKSSKRSVYAKLCHVRARTSLNWSKNQNYNCEEHAHT